MSHSKSMRAGAGWDPHSSNTKLGSKPSSKVHGRRGSELPAYSLTMETLFKELNTLV